MTPDGWLILGLATLYLLWHIADLVLDKRRK
jgi:hypothetical protein